MRVAVLAGGLGRRIGGMNKTELELCGKTLLEIALDKFSGYELLVVCRDEKQAAKLAEKYGRAKYIADEWKNFGSLAGVHAALKKAGSCVVTAVDMPFIKVEIVEHLFNLGEEMGCDALIPKHRHPEPLLAYYSKRSIEAIEEAMRNGIKKIVDVFRNLETVFYPTEELRKFDKDLLSFFNINTAENLRRAREICSEIDTGEL